MRKKIQKIRLTENELHGLIKEAVINILKEDQFSSEPQIELDELTISLSQAEELAKKEVMRTSFDMGENEVEIPIPGSDEYCTLIVDVDGKASTRLSYKGSTPSGGPDPDDYEENIDVDNIDVYFYDINGQSIPVSDDFQKFVEDNIEINPSNYEEEEEDDSMFEYNPDDKLEW